jgi:muramoyltetrapeptide carboxypeptidase
MNKQSTLLIKPDHLKYGDTIGIVAPASSFDADNFKKGVKMLRKIGYKVQYERSIFNKCWSQPGHNKQRGAQINRMFADKGVKAIFCAKGGYGSAEILPYLDEEVIKNNPKIFVGYSDITTLLLYLQTVAGMVVFHGPVVSGEIYEGMNSLTLEYLRRLITSPLSLGEVRFSQLRVVRSGRAKGILVGGNLSLIVDSMGKPYEIDTDNKILFLEDMGENSQDIYTYLMKLKEANKFKKIKGLVFGRMVHCFDEQSSFLEMLNEVFPRADVPVISRLPAGHIRGEEDLHFTLPLGISVTIDTSVSTFKVNEAGVK